jgi:hypothetical protein
MAGSTFGSFKAEKGDLAVASNAVVQRDQVLGVERRSRVSSVA